MDAKFLFKKLSLTDLLLQLISFVFVGHYEALPFSLALATKGYKRALQENPHLLAGLNIHRGALTYAAVAEAQKREFVAPERAIGR